MEQPWPQPQESAPDADDLPLAGLLAELLAASEGDSGSSASLPASAAGESMLDWQAEPVAFAEADQILRTLDQAPLPEPDSGAGSLAGMLLARLLEESAAESLAGGSAGAAVESASGGTGANVPIGFAGAGTLPGDVSGPPASPPAGTVCEATDSQAGSILSRFLGEEEAAEEAAGEGGAAAVPSQEASAAEPVRPFLDETHSGEDAETEVSILASPEDVAAAPAADGGPLPFAAVETGMGIPEDASPAAGIAPPEGQDGTGAAPPAPEAAEAASLLFAPDAASPGLLAAESEDAALEAAAAAPRREEAGPQQAAVTAAEAGALSAGDAGQASARPGPAPQIASAEPAAVSAGAEAVAADPAMAGAAHGRSAQAAEEDEFELVDASQAEKMVDQLLVAARSAIQSTQPAAGAGSMKESSPVAAAHPPVEQASPAERQAAPAEAVSATPEAKPASPPEAAEGKEGALAAGAGERTAGTEGRAPDAVSEDYAAEVSPIPPAVTLMALGLPERLRARLESAGDVERILQSQTALRAAPEQKPRLLVFRAGGESYALPMESVREVECVGRVTPVPGAPGFVRGLVNLRGEILPLLDLAALVGRRDERPAQRLIVAQAGPGDPLVALMVEELNGLAPFSEGEVKPPLGPGPVRGSLKHRGREVAWLDPVAVFGSEALEKAAGQFSAFTPEARA